MRPFLVLLLVLAALAALLFGILSLLGDDSTSSGTGPVTPVTEAPRPAPTPTSLDAGGTPQEERVQPVEAAGSERSTATADPDAWQYDNVLTGVVVNPQSQTLPNCEVRLATYYELIIANDPVDTSQDRSTRTDGNGRFTFTNLEPRDRYKLSVKHPDYTLKEIASVPVGERGEFVEPPITLAKGAMLQGYVRDQGGNNVDGASLILDGLMYQGVPYDPPDRMVATTDERGWYSFENVPRGQRSLTVSADGYGTISMSSLNFVKDEVVTKDLVLHIGEMIRGRVVSEGRGLPNAIVQALSFQNTAQLSRGQATTDQDGVFLFESLTPGEFNLIPSVPGYRFDGTVPRVRTGTDNVVIEMSREADVCGTVLDERSGSPVTSFTCRLRISNGPSMATSLTEYVQTYQDPRGEFCLNGIPTGQYVIEASAPGFAPTFSAPFSVNRGQAPSGNVVRLTRGGSISGRIVDGDGRPVPRARITTHDKDWADDTFSQLLGSDYPSNVTQVDVRAGEDGRFSLSHLTPEIYQMNIRAPGFTRWARMDIVVGEGEDTNLGDVPLSRGGSVRGTLFDPAGRPLVGGDVHLIADDGREGIGYSTKTDSEGKFLFTNVSAGRYQITASRATTDDENPFERFMDVKNSRKAVTVTEENVSVVEMTLSP